MVSKSNSEELPLETEPVGHLNTIDYKTSVFHTLVLYRSRDIPKTVYTIPVSYTHLTLPTIYSV